MRSTICALRRCSPLVLRLSDFRLVSPFLHLTFDTFPSRADPVFLKQARLELETLSLGILEIMFHKKPAKWINQSDWPYCSVSVARFFWQATHVADCDSFCFPLPWSKTWASEEKRKIFHFLPYPLIFPILSSTDFQLFFELFPSGIWFFQRSGFLQK